MPRRSISGDIAAGSRPPSRWAAVALTSVALAVVAPQR